MSRWEAIIRGVAYYDYVVRISGLFIPELKETCPTKAEARLYRLQDISATKACLPVFCNAR